MSTEDPLESSSLQQRYKIRGWAEILPRSTAFRRVLKTRRLDQFLFMYAERVERILTHSSGIEGGEEF